MDAPATRFTSTITMTRRLRLSADGDDPTGTIRQPLGELDADGTDFDSIEAEVSFADGSSISVSASGQSAAADLSGALRGIGIDERDVDAVHATLLFPDDAALSFAAVDDGDGEEESSDPRSAETPGRLTADTQEHLVMWLLREVNATDPDNGIDGHDLTDLDICPFDYGQISGCLSRLQGRKLLVDFVKKTANGNDRKTKHYYLTTAGEHELERLGSPDPDGVFSTSKFGDKPEQRRPLPDQLVESLE